jgi:hypothetical protein
MTWHVPLNPKTLNPQVLKFILKDPSDNTKVKLVYANIALGDILLKVRSDSHSS